MGFGCNVPDKCWDREGRRLAALLLLCSQILLCLSLGAVMRWEEKQHETASRLNYACLHLLTRGQVCQASSVSPHTHKHTHTHAHTHIDSCKAHFAHAVHWTVGSIPNNIPQLQLSLILFVWHPIISDLMALSMLVK